MSKRNGNTVLPVAEHIKLLLYGEAHEHPCDTCSAEDINPHLPPWYNKEKYKRGQEYIKRNNLGLVMATLCGVISAFCIPTILTVLMKTHRSSTTFSAYRRYLSTIKHFFSWFRNDLVPGTDAWKSLNTVRTRHIKWSKVSLLKKDGHISQRDLVLTLTAFGGMSLIRPHLLSMEHDNKEDLEAFCHFWRTIGFMLGIEDRYNSFRPSLDETLLVTEAICAGVYRPLIQNPPEYFYHMSSTYIQGLWYIDPTYSEGALHYFNNRLIGCDGFEYKMTGLEVQQKKERLAREKQLKKIVDFKKGLGYSEYPGKNGTILSDGKEFYKNLSLYNKVTVFFMVNVFQHLYRTLIGRIIGKMKGLSSLILIFVFPILAMLKFGIKDAYVNKYAEDIKIEVRIKTNKEMLAEGRF